ncbi:MAG: leishmanolysin-related zinc metalloendopeptidase, partial [Providencia heimbachae]|nr:leishmanolysin-related zinc metalloendopeptidase [Providencia heimbachae]
KTGSWTPIRIHISTLDLDDPTRYCTAAGQIIKGPEGNPLTCTEEDVLTPEKKSTLLNKLLPQAVALHSERLSVKPLASPIVVPSMGGDVCTWFTVPPAHHTSGVRNADFALYVRASPTEGNVMAWALMCAADTSWHPYVGVTNISPRFITETNSGVRVVAHELLHALGFHALLFSLRQMVSTDTVRGKGEVPVVSSPKVVQRAKEHFCCGTLPGMELEDEGGEGTALSHWERRNAKDELMSGISGIGYYTAITIAAMEDLGFYKGNYDKAESMSWGQNAGCDLLDKPCVVNGVSQFPSMFCTEQGKESCTTDRLAIGVCDTGPLMDSCPSTLPYSNAMCSDTVTNKMPGSVFGSSSRCFDGDQLSFADHAGISPAICADVKCGDQDYEVRVKGAEGYVRCTPGGKLALSSLSKDFKSGEIMCPPFQEVCSSPFQPSCKTFGDRAGAFAATGVALPPLLLAAALLLVL